MSQKSTVHIAIVGNPNSGKTSLFNQLTGLNQKVGNFPGVTVEKKSGTFKHKGVEYHITDLPGTYSLYPKSPDEQVVINFLAPTTEKTPAPDLILVVADATNLIRNLLLYSQVADLGLPVVLALTMEDMVERRGLLLDIEKLSALTGVPVVMINARTGKHIPLLKDALVQAKQPFMFLDAMQGIDTHLPKDTDKSAEMEAFLPALAAIGGQTGKNAIHCWQQILSDKKQLEALNQQAKTPSSTAELWMAKETIYRYALIKKLITQVLQTKPGIASKGLSVKIDNVLLHPIYGFLIFFGVLLLIFQAIFSWSESPMDWIEWGMAQSADWLRSRLPAGPFTDLLADGIVPGLSGILVFIPQIALLFCFISILEETGYMSRVMFINDKLMRYFGLNGKSVVPLISGVACAVPAILSTRSIENWRDRLITIFVTPLMSCSARIPVFTILISLMISPEYKLGPFKLQGLVLMGLYLLGFFSALITALIMKTFIKYETKGYFVMEMPDYRFPHWENVGLAIVEKVKVFVWEAGRIIMAISVVLWLLASFGPGDYEQLVKAQTAKATQAQNLNEEETDALQAALKLEYSYAGVLGKKLEPAIAPLGFDWKIGIALITSFAAREVFVGTMATIYSLGSDDEDFAPIRQRLLQEKNPVTGEPMFTLALCMSLLIFYVYAMQCMSTVAVVYRETKSWKWPLLQLVYMTGIAYLASLFTYNLLQ
jgi:ferrous iron transport protein B